MIKSKNSKRAEVIKVAPGYQFITGLSLESGDPNSSVSFFPSGKTPDSTPIELININVWAGGQALLSYYLSNSPSSETYVLTGTLNQYINDSKAKVTEQLGQIKRYDGTELPTKFSFDYLHTTAIQQTGSKGTLTFYWAPFGEVIDRGYLAVVGGSTYTPIPVPTSYPNYVPQIVTWGVRKLFVSDSKANLFIADQKVNVIVGIGFEGKVSDFNSPKTGYTVLNHAISLPGIIYNSNIQTGLSTDPTTLGKYVEFGDQNNPDSMVNQIKNFVTKMGWKPDDFKPLLTTSCLSVGQFASNACRKYCIETDNRKICKGPMLEYCALSSNLETDDCKAFCGLNDINCDLILSNYCKNLGDEAYKHEICACFLPDSFYQTYFGDLYSKVPTLKGLITESKECGFPTCARSLMKPFAVKNATNQICPNVSVLTCVQNLSLVNSGSISGSIDTKQVNDCIQKNLGNPNPNPQPEPNPQPNPEPNPQPNPEPKPTPTEEKSWIEKYWWIFVVIGVLIIIGIIIWLLVRRSRNQAQTS